MFQLYRDNIDDLLADRKKKKKGDEEAGPVSLRIILAEHSSTGLVQVTLSLHKHILMITKHITALCTHHTYAIANESVLHR